MPRLRLLALASLLLALIGTGATGAEAARTPLQLADAVERRARSADFAALDRFGDAAWRTPGRESLNRLHHVAWTHLNQGDFDAARRWNDRLAERAQRQGDARYVGIAHLNALTIRYDQGDMTAAPEMERIAKHETDWFVRVHAIRLTALNLMDQDRVGEGLKRVTDADALVPHRDPYAYAAHSALWEVAGIGLMELNDFDGAAAAFGRFEIDYSNPVYPRPDFDSLYNLAKLAVQTGDEALAADLYAAHHRLTERTGLRSLMVYDAALCASVADARADSPGVLRCLEPYGDTLGPAAFLAPQLLPLRAVALARTGQVRAARRDLDASRADAIGLRSKKEGYADLERVEAEILLAEGRPAAAFALLREYSRDRQVADAKRFSAGIGQITGDLQEKLDERRAQLDTAQANTLLQRDLIRFQTWVVAIAVVFVLSVLGALAWQIRQAAALKTARRRADAANLSKSQFLANMSHEIRTPLNGVVAMADALARADLKPRDHEMAEVIRSSGRTLERLLSDILDSARIESGQVVIEAAPFHLGQALRDVVALWRSAADEKGVRLTLTIDLTADRMVRGDAVRLRQVATNLVSNALKFTEAGAVAITVETLPDDRVRVSVTDTGVGFDEAQRSRIFGRFQQADGSITRRFGGTGLGLAISRDLVALMGGAMDCRAIPGEGATFWFDLPLPSAEAPAYAEQPAAPNAAPGALRVLLADDHPANRKVVEILLAQADVCLVCVENGAQAVDAVAGDRFDLILMDMQMPVMDGLSATRAIRALQSARGGPRTPIVMLTANAMAEHVAAGRAAGADGHLAKPITLDSLFAAIDAALSAPCVEDRSAA